MAGDAPSEGHGSSTRRRSSAAPDIDASREELERRERQRRLREIALQLRAEGKGYDPKAHRRKALALKDDRKPRRAHAIQLIIIPIFWNSREDEKAAVMAAAARAQEELRAAGLKADVDTTHKLTPGQKFRHWEERGVMMRIEIGPKEAEAGVCVLAQSAKAGEVATRQQLAMGTALVKAAGEALGVKITPDVVVNAAGTDGNNAPNKKVMKDSGDDDVAASEGRGGNMKPVAVRSGDDLEGDFDGDVLHGRMEEEKPRGKKTEKKKALHDGDNVHDEAIEAPNGQRKKKKKPKIITFP